MRPIYLGFVALLTATAAYSQPKNLRQWAQQDVLQAEACAEAHVGISIYDPATGKYWYQHQDDKFFMPASNTKIFTLFTGLQLLGDSLPGMRYAENDTALFIRGMADPSFLHPDFQYQPVMDLLTRTDKRIWLEPSVIRNKRFGPGWGWGDYADYYQPELNEWPMYGNVARVKLTGAGYTMTPQFPHRTGLRTRAGRSAGRQGRTREPFHPAHARGRNGHPRFLKCLTSPATVSSWPAACKTHCVNR